MQPKRLVLALLFSTAILIGWQFLFPSKLQTPPANQAKTVASPPVNGATAQPSAVSSGHSNPAVSGPVSGAPSSPNTQAAPHRVITVNTPLYKAKFDSHGAIAVSWILQKNKENGDRVF